MADFLIELVANSRLAQALLKYKAYIWRGKYYFVGKPFAANVRPTPIINLNSN